MTFPPLWFIIHSILKYLSSERDGKMNDVFVERMIKKKFETTDLLIVIGVVAAVILLGLVGLFVGLVVLMFPMLSLLVIAGAVFGGYKLISMRMLEYEYSLTNGFVTVDKILNRASRKRMTSFECSTCEDIGVYAEAEARLKTRSFDNRIFATEYSDHRNSWFMIVHSGKTGKTLVVFDPDEDLQEAIKKFIPRSLKFEKFGRG